MIFHLLKIQARAGHAGSWDFYGRFLVVRQANSSVELDLREIKVDNEASFAPKTKNSQSDDDERSSEGFDSSRVPFERRPYQGAVDEEAERQILRRGRTKMPKRLVNKQALFELGYPFEEEVL